jgi:hypothetical protein
MLGKHYEGPSLATEQGAAEKTFTRAKLAGEFFQVF